MGALAFYKLERLKIVASATRSCWRIPAAHHLATVRNGEIIDIENAMSSRDDLP